MSHATLAPSHASRWIHCTGSVAATKDVQDSGSVYAEEGTLAHAVGAARLENKPGPAMPDKDQSDYVQQYVNAIRAAAEGKILLIEQAVAVSNWTTEPGAKGTSDAVIIDVAQCAIEVHDLKFGMGHVVDADNNEQLMLYALGVLDIVEGIYFNEVKSIKLVIHQPRRDHVSEWTLSRADLIAFGERARIAGRTALAALAGIEAPVLTPSEAACLWCPIKATCTALAAVVHDAVFEEFKEIEGGMIEAKARMAKDSPVPSPGILAMVEDWLAAVKGYIDEQLKAGAIGIESGWKLVEGRRGNRAWTSEQEAETLAKKIRLKAEEMYDKSLKSPAQLEKIVPKKKWKEFEGLIGRSEAKPTVAPATDKRPEYKPVAEAADFDIFK